MDAVSYDLVGNLAGSVLFESSAMEGCVESTDRTASSNGLLS